MFHARFMTGQHFDFPITKVVCVGRNYAEHAKELNNPVPDKPILFIKPESSVVSLHEALSIPKADCHYETEIAVLIGSELKQADEQQAEQGIAGIGLAIDLTKRALQAELKAKNHPWEEAKAFDGACPLSDFLMPSQVSDLEAINFSLTINDELKQKGNSSDMLMSILPLIAHISQIFTLRPGDIVLTGTPKGVGELFPGDRLALALNSLLNIETIAT